MDLPTILCSLRALLRRCHSKLWPVRLATMFWGILKGKDQALIRCHEVSGMSQWKYPPGVCCNSLQASFLCADRAGELQESLLAFHRSTQTQTDNVSFWREATLIYYWILLSVYTQLVMPFCLGEKMLALSRISIQLTNKKNKKIIIINKNIWLSWNNVKCSTCMFRYNNY